MTHYSQQVINNFLRLYSFSAHDQIPIHLINRLLNYNTYIPYLLTSPPCPTLLIEQQKAPEKLGLISKQSCSTIKPFNLKIEFQAWFSNKPHSNHGFCTSGNIILNNLTEERFPKKILENIGHTNNQSHGATKCRCSQNYNLKRPSPFCNPLSVIVLRICGNLPPLHDTTNPDHHSNCIFTQRITNTSKNRKHRQRALESYTQTKMGFLQTLQLAGKTHFVSPFTSRKIKDRTRVYSNWEEKEERKKKKKK